MQPGMQQAHPENNHRLLASPYSLLVLRWLTAGEKFAERLLLVVPGPLSRSLAVYCADSVGASAGRPGAWIAVVCRPSAACAWHTHPLPR
jgi:hypothetical protein